MPGLAITLSLSILLTGFALIFSHTMIKTLKINHPKNRFWIYLIAMMSAFSIFSLTLLHTSDTTNISSQKPLSITFANNDKNHPYLTIQEETINLKNNTLLLSKEKTIFYSFLTINSSTCKENNYYTINSFNIAERKTLTKNTSPSSKSSKDTNLYQLKTTAAHSKPLEKLLDHIPDKTIIKFWIYQITTNTENIKHEHNSSTYLKPIEAEKHEKTPIPIFTVFNMMLLTAACIYLGFNLTMGKRYILKNTKAKKCQDPELLHMIKQLAEELKIKTPKIFIFNGNPNAFVSGYPVSLFISKELINCLSKKELRMVIHHELAHIKNKDILIKPLLQSMRILFFYNPLIHLLYYMTIKERELMADSLFIKSKNEKITFMEALVKIHEHIKRHKSLPRNTLILYSSLILHNPKKLRVKDRYTRLFGNTAKKTFYSLLICLIILLTNVSLIAVSQNILSASYETNNEQKTRTSEINPEIHCYSHPIEYIYISREYNSDT